MKSVIVSLLLASSSVFAQSLPTATIKCVFTEPFLSVTYSIPQQSLIVKGLDSDSEKSREYSIQILTVGVPGEFVALDSNGVELLKFSLDGRGSDGMSDEIYPISATLNLPAIDSTFSTPYNQLSGGCRFAK
jgi:hypothetical protein